MDDQFKRNLSHLLNSSNIDSILDAPDYIIADYIVSCLRALYCTLYDITEHEIKESVPEEEPQQVPDKTQDVEKQEDFIARHDNRIIKELVERNKELNKQIHELQETLKRVSDDNMMWRYVVKHKL